MVENKRIAKNAFYLYVRTFFVLILSLYISRFVLQQLGETDYGIYNVVGGVVAIFAFFSQALTVATQRFLNFEIGKKDFESVAKIFKVSMNIYIILSVVIVILGESIGLWFLNVKMNISADRMAAANWVYQLSILGTCLSVLRIPYNASIIAYERMNVYAMLGIVDVVLKLFVALLLFCHWFDSLIVYAFFSTLFILFVNILYYLYCKKSFNTCGYSLIWDKKIGREIIGLTGWTIMGSSANATVDQGTNILLNLFNGVVANAARGISMQVFHAVRAFISGFTTAVNPQLVKSFAAGENDDLMSFLFRSTRIAYGLALIICLPLVIFCEDILAIWLVNVPQFSVEFTQLIIIYCLLDVIGNSISTTIVATGKVKQYQIIFSIIIIINLPLSYILLKIGYSPIYVILLRVLIDVLELLWKIIYIRRFICLSIKTFMKEVISKIIVSTFISIAICCLIINVCSQNITPILQIIVAAIFTAITTFLIVLTKEERISVINIIRNKICKKNHG